MKMTHTQAANRGYNDFLNGITVCPFKDEVLISGWAEGWNRADGDDFEMKQEAAIALKAKDYDECGHYMGNFYDAPDNY